ncbi:hypothetical protein [Aquimarina algiphila]|uniref:hypothetical protein n=1 Tax=Aquimarina algiphila TaxID=2047982 RepID=UPI0023303D60|nr:hypothetical protein [Aquimarina algiphila]
MLFIPYTQLDAAQKELVTSKIAEKTKAHQNIVHRILSQINPNIKIVEQEVILSYDMLVRISEKCKSIKK